MNNEDNLLVMGQIAEAASLLMMIGALLWLFQPEIEEAMFSDKNYLDVKTIAVMLIVIPAVVAFTLYPKCGGWLLHFNGALLGY